MPAINRLLDWLKPRSAFDLLVVGFALVCLPLLFFGGFGFTQNEVGRMVWNLGHYFFFAAMTFIVLERCKGQTALAQMGHLVFVVLIGIGIEAIQIFTARDADVGDLVANIVGVLSVFFWCQRASWWVWLGRALFSGVLVGHCLFVGVAAVWIYHIEHRQPLISNFESSDQIFQWRGRAKLVETYVSEGEKSLQFELSTRRFSGVTLVRLSRNWTGYEALSFDLFNPTSSSINLVIRVHDKWHSRSEYAFDDRFNRRISVEPGWNTYELDLKNIQKAPHHRVMDMENIEEIILFSMGLKAPLTLYTDNWHLL